MLQHGESPDEKERGRAAQEGGRGRHETAFQCNVPAWCQNIHFIQKTSKQIQPQATLSSRGDGGRGQKTKSLLIVHHCLHCFPCVCVVFFLTPVQMRKNCIRAPLCWQPLKQITEVSFRKRQQIIVTAQKVSTPSHQQQLDSP